MNDNIMSRTIRKGKREKYRGDSNKYKYDNEHTDEKFETRNSKIVKKYW